MNPKVSLIVPCYNGEKFIQAFVQTVFDQDYDNIQLIITDDGSTDNSYQQLKSIESKMQEKGIEYILLHKENGGQSSAFNMGIQEATGKYVAWPDIDDRMHFDFISKKVNYMENNPDVDFLLSKSVFLPLNDTSKILGYSWPHEITNNNELMERVLKDRDCWFEPGAYFAKTSSLDRLIPDREIYEACGTWSGAQTQIILPFFYGGKIGYLNDCLYDYYIHNNQHHSQLKGKNELITKSIEVKKMLVETVKRLGSIEEEKYLEMIEERMIRTESTYAFQARDKEWFDDVFCRFSPCMINKKDILRKIIVNITPLYLVYTIYKKIKINPFG